MNGMQYFCRRYPGSNSTRCTRKPGTVTIPFEIMPRLMMGYCPFKSIIFLGQGSLGISLKLLKCDCRGIITCYCVTDTVSKVIENFIKSKRIEDCVQFIFFLLQCLFATKC